MPRYWVIAPIESNFPDFDKVWQFDVANNLITMGWGNLGDISKMSLAALSDAVVATFPDKRPSDVVNMLWAFYHEIGTGDFVIARRGRKILLAAGKVVRAGFYAPGRNPFIASGYHFHHNCLEVEWQAQPRDKVFETLVFRMHTLAKIEEDQYHKFLVTGSSATNSHTPRRSWAEPSPARKAPPAVDTSKVRKFGEGLQSVYVYGYVSAPEVLKIGKSEGDPVRRIASQITTGTPGRPTLHLIFHTDDCHNLERALHKILHLRKQKADGGGDEWFHTNCEELIKIYRFCVTGSAQNAELDDGSGPAPAG
jgi:hypothetical protein